MTRIGRPDGGADRCWPGRAAAVTAAGLVVLAVTGCSSGGVTAAKLESSIAGTFTNLYVLQQTEQGNPRPDPAGLQTTATCQRGTPTDQQDGAGNDWLCQVTFLVAGPATPVPARYDVNVKTDGCYAADGDGPASLNGTRSIPDTDGGQRVNPLRLLQGCFDVG